MGRDDPRPYARGAMQSLPAVLAHAQKARRPVGVLAGMTPALLAFAALDACAPLHGDALLQGARPGADTAAMVAMPGGTFMMGSPDSVGERQEHPQHSVTVRPFELDRTLVTVS